MSAYRLPRTAAASDSVSTDIQFRPGLAPNVILHRPRSIDYLIVGGGVLFFPQQSLLLLLLKHCSWRRRGGPLTGRLTWTRCFLQNY